MNRHPIVWFYILAFGISWLGWIPVAAGLQGVAPFDNPLFQILLILPTVGPFLAAMIVTNRLHGEAGIQSLLRALIQWRVGLVWYLIAGFGPLVLLLAGQAATRLLGLSGTAPEPQGGLLSAAIPAFVMSLLANPWEEIGWRGFALPHLQKRYHALPATLIVGVLWGLWHLPLFFWVGNPMSEYPFLPWFVSTVAGTFIYTWLYNSARGSLLPVTLFHVMLNTLGVVVTGVSITVLAVLYCLAALVLIAVFGGTNLSRDERIAAD